MKSNSNWFDRQEEASLEALEFLNGNGHACDVIETKLKALKNEELKYENLCSEAAKVAQEPLSDTASQSAEKSSSDTVMMSKFQHESDSEVDSVGNSIRSHGDAKIKKIEQDFFDNCNDINKFINSLPDNVIFDLGFRVYSRTYDVSKAKDCHCPLSKYGDKWRDLCCQSDDHKCNGKAFSPSSLIKHCEDLSQKCIYHLDV